MVEEYVRILKDQLPRYGKIRIPTISDDQAKRILAKLKAIGLEVKFEDGWFTLIKDKPNGNTQKSNNTEKASDLERRVKSLASLLAGSQLSPGQFVTGAATMIYVVQVATVLLHWLPLTSLATVALLPLIHLDSLILENNYGKGMMLFLVTMLLYPLLVIV